MFINSTFHRAKPMNEFRLARRADKLRLGYVAFLLERMDKKRISNFYDTVESFRGGFIGKDGHCKQCGGYLDTECVQDYYYNGCMNESTTYYRVCSRCEKVFN